MFEYKIIGGERYPNQVMPFHAMACVDLCGYNYHRVYPTEKNIPEAVDETMAHLVDQTPYNLRYNHGRLGVCTLS